MTESSIYMLMATHRYGMLRKQCGISFTASTPGLHQTNGVIERCNMEVEQDARVALHDAGLPICFWVYAAPLVCHLHNVEIFDEPIGEVTSRWYARHGEDFAGLVLPLG